TIKEAVLRGDIDKVLQYDRLGEAAALAVPMPDHYAPLLYTLGACTGGEQVTVFNPICVMGSLSMTGYLFEGGGTEQ
ncbi:MAG: 4,5-DOPA dioxygenase extradiol, partial [Pygmaiobacter sp.]|nr:4,5-DOPA dioxygenase extradiol [Pygmaiobacter sp.]